MEFDITKMVEKITMQVKESQEEFIFETINPYCEDILQMRINKEELKQIILNGSRKQQSSLNGIEWIPISERLPEKDGCYFITTKLEIHDLGPYYAVYTANFDGKYFDIGYIGEGISVIAWMPFPQPYKTESEVNDGNS